MYVRALSGREGTIRMIEEEWCIKALVLFLLLLFYGNPKVFGIVFPLSVKCCTEKGGLDQCFNVG